MAILIVVRGASTAAAADEHGGNKTAPPPPFLFSPFLIPPPFLLLLSGRGTGQYADREALEGLNLPVMVVEGGHRKENGSSVAANGTPREPIGAEPSKRQEKYYKSAQSGESVTKCEHKAFMLSEGLLQCQLSSWGTYSGVILLTCQTGLNKFC